MIKIGIIGFGYWGPNLARNFASQPDTIVKKIADARMERRKLVKSLYASVEPCDDGMDVINDPEIDAVVIATPVYSHFKLAKSALEYGKHVLIEKPMTATVTEAETLIDMALQKSLTLMVDQTFLYTGAVRKIKELVSGSEIGKLRYFDSTRINLGLFQPDINVLWDLAPHDLSILAFITKEKPVSVNATGVSHTENSVENIGYLTINYQDSFVAHLNCSWTSPVKVRSTLIGGDKKMILYNDLEPSEKIRVYNTAYSHETDEERNRILVDYRTGDVLIPKLDNSEALSHVATDFISAIMNGSEPVSNAKLGLEVVKILEASSKSMKNGGVEVKI